MLENLRCRPATRADLPEIVRMLSDDDLGKMNENYQLPLPDCYYAAFEKINADLNIELIVAELDKHIVGSMQLIYIPSLSYQGQPHAQVEAVRVDAPLRGNGIGQKMMEWQ